MYIKIWVFVLSLLAALLIGGLIGYLYRLGIGNLWTCLKSLGVLTSSLKKHLFYN